jgi:hypothetical protein
MKCYGLAVVLGMASATISKPVFSEIINCSDATYLFEQSATSFASIREQTQNEDGGFKSKFNLPGTEYCEIIEDVEKVSYRCTWKYTYGDEQASYAFKRLASELVSCLGDEVNVREDQAVNHPDSYGSYLFTLPETEARITLKNKIELDSTFVSFFIVSVQK